MGHTEAAQEDSPISAEERTLEEARLHWLSKPLHEISGTTTPPATNPQFGDSWVPPSEEDWDNEQLAPLQEPEVPLAVRPRIVSVKRPQSSARPKALYLFAGLQRKSDVSSILRKLGWEVEDVDILRSRAHDLSKSSVSDRLLHRIKQNEFAAVIASPPCNTYTRVMFANNRGPRPMRTFVHPMGLPHLSAVRKKIVQLANTLTSVTMQAALAQASNSPGHLIIEFPEDLGAVKHGEWYGQRPASLWQRPEVNALLAMKGISTFGLRQSDFGTPFAKPTRLLVKATMRPHTTFNGMPVLDPAGFYLGPIPPAPAGLIPLARGRNEVGFRTTGTAAWPSQLCHFIAHSLNDSLRCDVLTEKVENAAAQDVLEPMSPCTPPSRAVAGSSVELTPEPLSRRVVSLATHWVGGVGPPRLTYALGKPRQFHDGAGLTSPGRWDKKDRIFPMGHGWNALRAGLEKELSRTFGDGLDRLPFRFAAGPKEEVFDEHLLRRGRLLIHDWLKGEGCSPTGLVAPGQPFLLDTLHHLLARMKDADFEICKEFEEGVTAGILSPLPRTPEIFEEQVSWKLKQDSLYRAELQAENYTSIDDHVDAVRVKFKEDQELGLMREYTDKEFFDTFGKDTAISSLAVLVEKDKLRVLHDGTHKTMVNHRIKCRDKIRMPGVREKHHLLRTYKEAKHCPLSVLGDVKNAHRLIKIVPAEWGMQACRLDEGLVWVNMVGTFGIASAAYWWSRLSGCLLRCVYGLLGPLNPLDMLLYADDLELLGINARERRSMVLALFYLALLGVPMKLSKFHGGFRVEWIGLYVDYTTYSVGLSEKRASWLIGWIQGVLKLGKVGTRDFAGALGRLGFAVTALFYEKAFLGILYLWSGAISSADAAVVTVPWAVRLILSWLAKRLQGLGRVQEVPLLPIPGGELFRSDAKAEDGRAVIGGWECAGETPSKSARWFALDVERSWAPWAFAKQNDPGRVIATLELLGTLVSIIAFGDSWKGKGSGTGCITGSTDNQGNTYATAKMMSSKWPLTVLLIELSEQLRSRHMELQLLWRRRDLNQEADDLTNGIYTSFDPVKRVVIDPASIPWLVLDEIMADSELLYKSICSEREASKSSGLAPKKFGYKKIKASLRLRTKDPW